MKQKQIEIGLFLKQKRVEVGISVDEVAGCVMGQRGQVTTNWVYRMERGEIDITLLQFFQVAQALHIDSVTLLAELVSEIEK